MEAALVLLVGALRADSDACSAEVVRAREELTESDRPVSVIAHRWGFCGTSHLSRSFKAHYGNSPTDYRNAFRLDGAPGDASVQRPVARIQALDPGA
jgi:hypothetical protein